MSSCFYLKKTVIYFCITIINGDFMRILFNWLMITTAILSLGLLGWLSTAVVELTSGGAYHSILLPLPGNGAIRWHAKGKGLAEQPTVGLHGPVVNRHTGLARWVCGADVQQLTLPAERWSTLHCGDRQSLAWYGATRVQSSQHFPQTPARIAVISDLEGQQAFFLHWAATLGIIDAAANWQYGAGHLVILGDFMDRGRDVYPLLWTLYRLQQQADAAGGAVHVLLGNHELYNLTGRLKDVEAEHLWAMSQLGTYHGLLSADTVLGHWLRQQPVVIQLGDILFSHGGLSPQLLAKNLSIDAINQAQWHAIQQGHDTFWFSPAAPAWYRGYFESTPALPQASQTDLNQLLAHYQARFVVVGHTQRAKINASYQGAVYGVEVMQQQPESLLFVNGQPEVLQLAQLRPDHRQQQATTARVRAFDFLNPTDWLALWPAI